MTLVEHPVSRVERLETLVEDLRRRVAELERKAKA